MIRIAARLGLALGRVVPVIGPLIVACLLFAIVTAAFFGSYALSQKLGISPEITGVPAIVLVVYLMFPIALMMGLIIEPIWIALGFYRALQIDEEIVKSFAERIAK